VEFSKGMAAVLRCQAGIPTYEISRPTSRVTSRLLTTWKPALDKTKNDVILGKQNYLMEYLGLPVGANYLMEYNLKDVILGKQNVRFVCVCVCVCVCVWSKLNNYRPKTEYPRQKLNVSIIGILESSYIEYLISFI
jgi:hypothetical protein